MAGRGDIQLAITDDETNIAANGRRKLTKQRLYRAAMKGDWETAKGIFSSDGKWKAERLNPEGMNALHVAANCGRSEFVVKLVGILGREELEMKNQVGRNALHYVALASEVIAAKAIVDKAPDLVQEKEAYRYTPLFYAARWRRPTKNNDMLNYLYNKTKEEVLTDSNTAPSLVVAITASGSYDIALQFIRTYPAFATQTNLGGWTILHILASQKPTALGGVKKSTMEKILHPKKNYELKQRRAQALQLVHLVCRQLLLESSESAIMEYFLPSNRPAILHSATKNGVFELVHVCLKYFPDLIWYSSGDERKVLLQVAIEYRQTEVFNDVMELIGKNAGAYAGTTYGKNLDNMLHVAAKLAPTPQLHSVPGPAFQMQQEIKWFQAVEALVYRDETVEKNRKHKTPDEVFYAEHAGLMKNAKEWMKDTSTSCMVVAALVATVAFAAVITVPGGNDSETGTPVLSRRDAFVGFSIANAISMLSSAISLFMFLSLQTSRYSIDDFEGSLPQNLFRGLFSLFVAVASMMVAFGTSLGMAFQERPVKWLHVLISVVGSFPVLIFSILHLPLFRQAFKATSGPELYGHPKGRKKLDEETDSSWESK